MGICWGWEKELRWGVKVYDRRSLGGFLSCTLGRESCLSTRLGAVLKIARSRASLSLFFALLSFSYPEHGALWRILAICGMR